MQIETFWKIPINWHMIDGKMYPTLDTLFVQNKQIKTYQN